MAAGDISLLIPSGSTNGRMVKVAATATAGTTLHTAHATHIDEVYVWAVNNDTGNVLLTIELGGTSSPDDLINITLPPKEGLALIVPGIRLTGSVVVRAFASVANKVSCAVNINRTET